MVRPRSSARQASRRGDGRASRVVNHEQSFFSRGIPQRTISGRATDQAQRGVDCARGGRSGLGGDPRLHPAEPAERGAALPGLAGSAAARHSTALRRHSRNGHRAGLRGRPDRAVAPGCQACATPKSRHQSTACGKRTGGLKATLERALYHASQLAERQERLRRRMQPHAGCGPLRGRRRPRPGRPRRSSGWHRPRP